MAHEKTSTLHMSDLIGQNLDVRAAASGVIVIVPLLLMIVVERPAGLSR